MTESFDMSPIESAVQLYFDALYECDVEKFDKVFHPVCMLGTVRKGRDSVLTLPAYRKFIGEQKSPKEMESPREEGVDAIVFLSPDVALVKARARIGDKRYADHLNLVKVGGTWRIFSKLYVEV